MSDTSIFAILSSVGIMLVGTVTSDAAALAAAVNQGTVAPLVDFVRQHPDSHYAPDAILLAAILSQSRLEDYQVSDANPDLTCRIVLEVIDDETAILKWQVTDAVAIGLFPANLLAGQPLASQGERPVSLAETSLITLIAKDAAGNSVRCAVHVVHKATSLESLATPNDEIVSI